MCEQCFTRPPAVRPTKPKTKPTIHSSPSTTSNAPSITPPFLCVVIKVSKATISTSCIPQISRWSCSTAWYSSSVLTGRISIAIRVFPKERIAQRMKVTEGTAGRGDGATGRQRDGWTAWINKVRLRLSFYRLVAPSLRLNAVDQDFVDAATIHVHHLDSQTVPDEMIGGRGQSSEVGHDESGQRVVTAFFFSGQPLDRKQLLKVRDPHPAVEQPGPVFAPDGEALDPSGVGRHFADYRFQHVVHRHQPL